MKKVLLVALLVTISVVGCLDGEPVLPPSIIVANDAPCVDLPEHLYTTRFQANIGEPVGCVVRGYLKGRYINSAFESDGSFLMLGKVPAKGELCPKESDTIEVDCIRHYYKKTVGEMLDELQQNGFVTLSHK